MIHPKPIRNGGPFLYPVQEAKRGSTPLAGFTPHRLGVGIFISKELKMDKDYFLMLGFSLEEAEERAGYSYVSVMSEESFEERYLRGMMEVAEARKGGSK